MTRHADHQPARHEVVAWRVKRLREAGFQRAAAERLARDQRYDLHELLDLVDRGCRPDLAARILAPLDDPEPPAC